jgi:hypothetical protein
MELDKSKEYLIRKYGKHIIHMRQQQQRNKFGLCCGAGISKDFNIPTWEELVFEISKNKTIEATNLLHEGQSLTIRVQLLFEHFRTAWLKNHSTENDKKMQKMIIRDWIQIIHDEMYKNVSEDSQELNHTYLKEFIPIIINSTITINYNFDDFIERLIIASRDKNKQYYEREYETIWDPSIQFKRNKGVIYHPNGFIPYNLIEGFSENFVFSESAFADQLIDSISGHYNALQYYFSKITFLFIGISLNDTNLKHMLRQNVRLSPGNFHYYIYYVERSDQLSEEEKNAIQKTYFNMYNLITLFLTGECIKELGSLLNCDESTIGEWFEKQNIPTVYRYYISGSVATGKTTSINNLKSFCVYNEWPDPKKNNLNKPHTQLSPLERTELDQWISSQFYKKNFLISSERFGIQIIDRSPLDPIAFSEYGKWNEKAISLMKVYLPGKDSKIVDGQIVLLEADSETIIVRLIDRNSEYEKGYLDILKMIFSKIWKKSKCVILNTTELDIEMMIKKIIEIIFFSEYKPINIGKVLSDISCGKILHNKST